MTLFLGIEYLGNVALYLAFAVYIVAKNPREMINRVLAALFLACGVWSAQSLFLLDRNTSLRTIQIVYACGAFGWGAVNILLFWFILLFTEQKKVLRSPFTYLFFAAFYVLTIYGQSSGGIIKPYVWSPAGWSYICRQSVWAYLFFAANAVTIILGIVLIELFRRRVHNEQKKKQADIILVSYVPSTIVILFIGVAVPLAGIPTYSFISHHLGFVLALGVLYAVTKHRFLSTAPDVVERMVLSMPDLFVFGLDGAGVITTLNQAMEKALGYARHELEGRPLEVLVERSAVERGTLPISSTVTGEQRITLKTKADGHIMAAVIASPVVAKNGQLDGMICIGRNLTEQEVATAAARELEQRLAAIIDFLPDPTFIIDRQHRVVSWNRAMADLTGVSPAKMVGKGAYEHSLPFYGERRPILIDLVLEPHADIEKNYTTIVRSGDALFAEAMMPAMRPGEEVMLWGVARPLYDSQGRITGAIETIRDISEQQAVKRTLEKQLDRFKLLYKAALDIAAKRSIDDSLFFIVVISRQLLNADAAFIAFADPARQELYIRSHSGVVSDAFKNLRIPYRASVGGSVLASGKGQIIEDCMQAIGRDPVIGPVVVREGIVSSLAVPIQTAEQQHGVLYVANRKRTRFTQDDLDIITLLGNLSADGAYPDPCFFVPHAPLLLTLAIRRFAVYNTAVVRYADVAKLAPPQYGSGMRRGKTTT